MVAPKIDEQVAVAVFQLSDDAAVDVKDRLHVDCDIGAEPATIQQACDLGGDLLLFRALPAAHEYFTFHLPNQNARQPRAGTEHRFRRYGAPLLYVVGKTSRALHTGQRMRGAHR